MSDERSLFDEGPPAAAVDRVMALDLLPPDEQLFGEPSPELSRSVARMGLLNPVLIAERQEGEYLILDGRRRIKAARKAGHLMVAARIYPHGAVRDDVVTLTANAARKENPLCEYWAIKRLMAQGAGEKEIHEATGLPIQTIRKRLRLDGLDPSAREAMEEGRLSYAAAEAMLKLPRDRQRDLLEGEEKVSATEVREARMVGGAPVLPATLFGTPAPALHGGSREEILVTAAKGVLPAIPEGAAREALLAALRHYGTEG